MSSAMTPTPPRMSCASIGHRLPRDPLSSPMGHSLPTHGTLSPLPRGGAPTGPSLEFNDFGVCTAVGAEVRRRRSCKRRACPSLLGMLCSDRRWLRLFLCALSWTFHLTPRLRDFLLRSPSEAHSTAYHRLGSHHCISAGWAHITAYEAAGLDVAHAVTRSSHSPGTPLGHP